MHCSPSAFGLLLHRNRSLALLSAAGLPSAAPAGAWGESLWNVQPVHCSPSAFGLLLHRNRSLALLSAAGLPSAAPAGAWGESLWNVQPVHCSPSAFGNPQQLSVQSDETHRLTQLPCSGLTVQRTC